MVLEHSQLGITALRFSCSIFKRGRIFVLQDGSASQMMVNIWTSEISPRVETAQCQPWECVRFIYSRSLSLSWRVFCLAYLFKQTAVFLAEDMSRYVLKYVVGNKSTL